MEFFYPTSCVVINTWYLASILHTRIVQESRYAVLHYKLLQASIWGTDRERALESVLVTQGKLALNGHKENRTSYSISICSKIVAVFQMKFIL
jgi:hypothetical protein